MRITMLTSAATMRQCYQGGHTYDVSDADGAELIRAGHAREAEGIEDPDIVITRKSGKPKRPEPTVKAEVPKLVSPQPVSTAAVVAPATPVPTPAPKK